MRARFFLLLALGLLVYGPLRASAASLLLRSQLSSVAEGAIARVSVLLSSDVPVNAIAAHIAFQKEYLQIISVSKSDSAIDYWVQEPKIGESAVFFEGITNTPLQGADIKILEIVFRTLRAGVTPLTFANAEILAADGYGTSALTTAGVTSVVITSAINPSPAAPPLARTLSISSPTHPRSRLWYSIAKPVFEWSAPQDYDGAAYSITAKPATPDPVVMTKSSRIQAAALSDGIYFFNLRVRSKLTGWSEAAHYEFRIDTKPPEPFAVSFPHGDVSADARPIVLFNTSDTLSGMNYYEVLVNNKNSKKIAAAEIVASNPYALPEQEAGTHTVVVRAYDSAGNMSIARAAVEIQPITPPHIVLEDDSVAHNQDVNVFGKTVPQGVVTIHIVAGDSIIATNEARADSAGSFNATFTETIIDGEYEVIARVRDATGSQSAFSEPVHISIGAKGSRVYELYRSSEFLWIVIIICIILLCAAVVAWQYRSFAELRKKVFAGGARTASGVGAARIEAIVEEIGELEAAMTTRSLTHEEAHILSQLRLELAHLLEKKHEHKKQ